MPIITLPNDQHHVVMTNRKFTLAIKPRTAKLTGTSDSRVIRQKARSDIPLKTQGCFKERDSNDLRNMKGKKGLNSKPLTQCSL